jgi:acyl carrier protein
MMNQKLATVLAEVFELRETDIHPGLHRDDVGTWDSLKQMDLVVTLERGYDISLEVSDIVRMVSVAAILEVLAEKGVDVEA